MSKTVLIMAGGTGGHVFPGLAMAQTFRDKGWAVHWLGTVGGMEEALVTQQGFSFRALSIRGVRGKTWSQRLLALKDLALALYASFQWIRYLRPDLVLGFGGYPAFPGGVATVLLRIPLVIHEQNSVAGTTNRILAPWAKLILLGFPGVFESSRTSRFLCGNPVRRELVDLPPPEERWRGREGAIHLLVLGGSQGAQAINDLVPQALALIPEEKRPHVVHQGGIKGLVRLETNYKVLGVQAEALGFIADMASYYGSCDGVICRAGALTIAELAVVGVGALLIPLPNAIDDHQRHNAYFLGKGGAAKCIEPVGLTPQKLAEEIQSLDRQGWLKMAQKARLMGSPNASVIAYEQCSGLLP